VHFVTHTSFSSKTLKLISVLILIIFAAVSFKSYQLRAKIIATFRKMQLEKTSVLAGYKMYTAWLFSDELWRKSSKFSKCKPPVILWVFFCTGVSSGEDKTSRRWSVKLYYKKLFGTKCTPLGVRYVFIILAYCILLWCKTLCNILSCIINNVAISKMEDVKRYKKTTWYNVYVTCPTVGVH
jgi:hypothetical protein